jgi:hypothetical protein
MPIFTVWADAANGTRATAAVAMRDFQKRMIVLPGD